MPITYKAGDKDRRPWGTWEVLATGPNFIIKRIVVDPGQILSLQSHNFRTEHWVITEGAAEVTLDDKIFPLSPNEHVFIPLKAKHRIANRGKTSMVFVEIQMGDTLDENDIIRYEDVYNRK